MARRVGFGLIDNQSGLRLGRMWSFSVLEELAYILFKQRILQEREKSWLWLFENRLALARHCGG